jgi:hypothetical protein
MVPASENSQTYFDLLDVPLPCAPGLSWHWSARGSVRSTPGFLSMEEIISVVASRTLVKDGVSCILHVCVMLKLELEDHNP